MSLAYRCVLSCCFYDRLWFPSTSSSRDLCPATGDVEEAEPGQVCVCVVMLQYNVLTVIIAAMYNGS